MYGQAHNDYRNILTGALDRRYLRYCAVRRLFEGRRGAAPKIGKARAVELLQPYHKGTLARAIVEMWIAHSTLAA